MRILIVHDRDEVRLEIAAICQKLDRRHVVLEAVDYLSAKSMLTAQQVDVAIVDLTIPISKGMDVATYEPASKLVKELVGLGYPTLPADIIGITRDDDALGRIRTDVGSHLMTLVHEGEDGAWREQLAGKVSYIANMMDARLMSAMRHHLIDVAIVTAMDREAEPYIGALELSDVSHFPGAKSFEFRDHNQQHRTGVLFSIGRSGQATAASSTQALLTVFRPSLAIMTGYCGGVRGKVSLGDVLFFDATYAWDYGKWDEEGPKKTPIFRSRPNPISIDGMPAYSVGRSYQTAPPKLHNELLGQAVVLSGGRLTSYKVHQCPVASGSAVVANDGIVSQIRGLNDSIWGVDMESYGFYYAAKHTPVAKPSYFCVKAVSDYCNGEKEDGLHAACSYLSASYALDIIRNRWEF